ncbi:MAG TPA: RDD family protein [Thermoplasmata archaeon]|nr:RDD family protein [Thermoplasmata archaeon]
MVDVGLLTLDIASTVVTLVLPGGAWALLFVLAWEHPAFAESIGLGRRVFWLLLPGALLVSYAILPFATISVDWIAVDLGGAMFPLAVGGLALGRYAPPLRRSGRALLIVLVAEAAGLLAVVWPSLAPAWDRVGAALGIGGGGATELAVAVGAAVTAAVVAGVALRRPEPWARPIALVVGLVSLALALTFAGSTAIPGVGIEETFPYFLLPPILVGLIAGALAERVFPRAEGFALPAAYLAGTVGVLLGADLLRQPPLYGSGPPGLYAIGGAGILDLVYLSGLLAFAAATLVHLLARRGWAPVGGGRPAPAPNPIARLRAAFRAGVAGDLPTSIGASVGAARDAADRARALLGAPPTTPERPWAGLPVPGWVVSDHANLESVARSGTTDPREGYRAWITARGLVFVGFELSIRRFGSIGARLLAFGVDLVVVFAPAVVVFAAIAQSTGGGLLGVLDSATFNAAIVGFVSVALLYFVLSESLIGTTLGKALFGLEVRTRRLEIPDGLSALVRNAPLAPVLTVLGIGGALGVAVAAKGVGVAGLSLDGVAIPGAFVTDVGIALFLGGGLVMLGLVGLLAMVLTSERQRVGDLWAGTWVIRAVRAAPRPPDAPPPGAVRSG